MAFSEEEIKEAYIKLKTYIYFDTTDILLRRKFVEFETNTLKDDYLSIVRSVPKYYPSKKFLRKDSTEVIVQKKLEIILESLNGYHTNSKFFEYFLNQIDILFFPKEIARDNQEQNFLSNKRVQDTYSIKRVTAFIDAPIEIHLISILWIIKYGKNYDAQLSDSCYGNRLLLNKNKDQVVKGSGLFKPYHSQYQKWRDESISVAHTHIKNNKSILFLNLDIRDYFHSNW